MRDLLSSSPIGQAVERRYRPRRPAASSSERNRSPRARAALAARSRNTSTLGTPTSEDRLASTRGPARIGARRFVKDENANPGVATARSRTRPSVLGRRSSVSVGSGSLHGAFGATDSEDLGNVLRLLADAQSDLTSAAE